LRRDELTEPGLSLATDPSRLKFKIRQTLKIKSSAIAAANESKLSAQLRYRNSNTQVKVTVTTCSPHNPQLFG
jgi:hypothetical protein